MKYGYARISTIEQNADMQLKALQRAGCKKIFTDRLTGATTKRPALLRCLKTLQDGDTLTVWKLDRLARSLRDLIAMLEEFEKRERMANVYAPSAGDNFEEERQAQESMASDKRRSV